jgi:methylaspartate mutase sigma subunit
MDEKTIVTGVIGGDCHIVGNWILRHALSEAGFNVISLGACVSQEEFIDAAVETNADAILVSSIYGHGILDCEGFRDKCIEAGLKDIILYAGGSLTTEGQQDWDGVVAKFEKMGFNRIYWTEVPISTAIADLKQDLQIAG